jgi:hypothetical protein
MAPTQVEPPQQQTTQRPLTPGGIAEKFLLAQHAPAANRKAVYRPALLAAARLHFVRASFHIDDWDDLQIIAMLQNDSNNPWEESTPLSDEWELDAQPEEGFAFAAAPADISNDKAYGRWETALKSELYRTKTLILWECKKPKLRSTFSETEGEFRIRLTQLAKEARDDALEKLHKKYAKNLARANQRIETAQAAVEREDDQYKRATYDSAIKIGSSIFGALFGRKLASSTNVTRASTSARSVGSAAQQRGDVSRAKEKLDSRIEEKKLLEEELEDEIEKLAEEWDIAELEIKSIDLRPRKSDIQIEPLQVVWTPWQIDESGLAEPLFELHAEATSS